MYKQLFILSLASFGLYQVIQFLPRINDLRKYLEKTWTKGKPLTCNLCMTVWCSLFILLSMQLQNQYISLFHMWLMGIGIVRPVIDRLFLIIPDFEVLNDKNDGSS